MKNFFPIILAYILALIAAAFVIRILPYGILINTLIADIVSTFVIFGFSRLYKNSSFYDAYWSLVPLVIVLYWFSMLSTGEGNTLRAFIMIALVWWWGIRLTLNWASHWPGMIHEDWRYAPIRDKAGKFEMMADFGGIHLFPTLIVFAGCLPIYAVMKFGTGPLGWFDGLAIVVTVGAILIESIADVQLHRFIKIKKSGDFIKSGLWRYSRHPNYFGELGFWVGLMLFGLAVHPYGWWWITPGAIAMGMMFIFVSIPLMDDRSLASRDGYAAHMKKTPALIPWFPK